MRHTFASLLVQDGVPITYVAAQLGHRDSSITLRVYSHWLPDASRAGLVDRLDETTEDGPQTAPRAFDEHDQKSVSALKSMVSRGNRTPPQIKRFATTVHGCPMRQIPWIVADLRPGASTISADG